MLSKIPSFHLTPGKSPVNSINTFSNFSIKSYDRIPTNTVCASAKSNVCFKGAKKHAGTICL